MGGSDPAMSIAYLPAQHRQHYCGRTAASVGRHFQNDAATRQVAGRHYRHRCKAMGVSITALAPLLVALRARCRQQGDPSDPRMSIQSGLCSHGKMCAAC